MVNKECFSIAFANYKWDKTCGVEVINEFNNIVSMEKMSFSV